MDLGEADSLWIFAYGSLMWRPDFPFLTRARARVSGYHRSLCIASDHWRGTPDRPGLVLGLDRGGSCVGIVFEVPAHHAAATLAAVRARELIGGVYHETRVGAFLPDGTSRQALTYVADRTHAAYTGRLDRDTMLARVRQGIGHGGLNADYVRATYAHMRELGLADPDLAWIVVALGRQQAVPLRP